MTARICLSLTAGATVIRDDEGMAVVSPYQWYERQRQLTVPPGADDVHVMLECLERGKSTEDELIAALGADPAAMARGLLVLENLDRLTVLVRSLREGDSELAALSPCSANFTFVRAVPAEDAELRLSRFALLRFEAGRARLESPLSHAVLEIRDGRLLALVWALGCGTTPAAARARVEGLPAAVTDAVLGLLSGAGFLTPVDGDGRTAEEADVVMMPWEFHDLLFHSRSRIGRHRNGYGQSYRFTDRLPPPPALLPPPPGPTVSLPPPQAVPEVPFAEVLERRRSRRRYGRQPLNVATLSTFLYLAARERRHIHDGRLELLSRPYPSGGSLYEQRIYLLVQRCGGLEAGLYRYDGERHALDLVSEPGPDLDELVRQAATATACDPVQVLVIIAARFQRPAWKYESMAYALVLKNTGVLVHSLYLVAEALGLAPCGVGGGDSDLFSRAAGTRYVEETSVGEFLLGSRAPGPEPHRPHKIND